MRSRALLTLCLLLLLGGGAAAAQDPWPEAYGNPAPLPDDLVLPMPCGGAMAFRRIEVPSDGLLGDRRIVVGGADERFGHIENSRYAYLAGSFSDPATPGSRHYYLAKYELNRRQKAAIEGDCSAGGPESRLPAGGLGWFDAVALAHRYSLWLLEEAAARLPEEAGQPGFLRLPTEVEWEYAARGGAAVSAVEFEAVRFPMPDGVDSYVWYQSSRSAAGEPQFVGLKAPNPLGLHDMLGNLEELVLEPFRLNKLSRLHGQAGGVVVKGGSYLTSLNELRTAYRQEIPPYRKGAENAPVAVGLRLALVATAIPSRGRYRDIEEAWRALPTSVAISARTAERDDPLAELKLIIQGTGDETLRARLAKVERALEAGTTERIEERTIAAKADIRLGAFLVRKLAEDQVRMATLERLYETRRNAGAAAKLLAQLERNIANSKDSIASNLDWYGEVVKLAAEAYSSETVAAQQQVLAAEFASQDLERLVPDAETFVGHIAAYRTSGRADTQAWLGDIVAR